MVEVPVFANRTRFVDEGGAVESHAMQVLHLAEEARTCPDVLLEAEVAGSPGGEGERARSGHWPVGTLGRMLLD